MKDALVMEVAAEVMKRPARLGHTRLVAIDGPSGAGKTYVAERLAASLDPAPPVVHTDDLLDGWDDQVTFWPRLERWILAPLRAGRPGRYQKYDWHARRFSPEWTVVPPAPVVIVEGVTAARAAIRPEATLSIFVAAPRVERHRRAIHRDGETLRPYLEKWWRGEDAHFAADATAHHADLVVDVREISGALAVDVQRGLEDDRLQ
ncbi:hypothetical protein WEI85_14820 [Actinomycetes bacterium KLBMP 9797]